jgi:hypothetical protein
MEPVVFRLDVLVAIMNSNNHVRPNAVNPSMERIRGAFDFRDHGCLRFLPPPGGILATDTVDAVVWVLPVRFVYASDLQIHLGHPFSIQFQFPFPKVRSQRTNASLANFQSQENSRFLFLFSEL